MNAQDFVEWITDSRRGKKIAVFGFAYVSFFLIWGIFFVPDDI